MTNVIRRSALSVVITLAAMQDAAATTPFECPTKPIDAASAATVAAILPKGDAFDHIAQLNAAVDVLRAKGVSPAIIIDSLVAAYCPIVASQSQLTDTQKTIQVAHFASHITRVVYSLGSAEAIILDVAVPPLVADAINAKAKAAGVSSSDWIRATLESALR